MWLIFLVRVMMDSTVTVEVYPRMSRICNRFKRKIGRELMLLEQSFTCWTSALNSYWSSNLLVTWLCGTWISIWRVPIIYFQLWSLRKILIIWLSRLSCWRDSWTWRTIMRLRDLLWYFLVRLRILRIWRRVVVSIWRFKDMIF